jgi:hypothetical protein
VSGHRLQREAVRAPILPSHKEVVEIHALASQVFGDALVRASTGGGSVLQSAPPQGYVLDDEENNLGALRRRPDFR